MRAVAQRVSSARVSVGNEVVGEIGRGLMVLLGVGETDDLARARRMAEKITGLRIFEDADGRVNLDVAEAGGEMLCISQFTLYGDVRRGRRPSFAGAAPAEAAEPLYDAFCEAVAVKGIRCARGVFGAHMAVELVNDGPVTLIVDSELLERSRRA